ncbi:hypothetical protein CFC21_077767 [Triticum aestivum]|uniref:Leucine-rich repeat-containing N-terminal plant-type domain-containing protein n=3 Tax=Triticinae TaxID=1648030 RepID=A0A453KWI7_AEGTS|nr:putative leucine-rich repeat receptor-like serine/threonine-protein kinase At2g24130 isoform X2 [Aegilops tauschii subsp. strangulata]KAF7072665.1 hypothetical protein CFC21_077767 [Triticum aestivum]
MRAPMAVRLAAILLLLHLTRFHAMAAAAGERRAGTIVWQQHRRQVLLQEKATLLALKRSLTLPSPSALADWNESNGDVCGLTGVACDWRRQHVIGLSLGDKNISGPVPPVIGNLTRLKSLDMSRNFLAGQIPAELSNLRGLEVLDLGHNQLSGGIPPSLSELANMYYLSLKDNQLSGPIPAVLFKNCTSLGLVDFGNNDLSGEIPLEASENILVLNLYSNMLTGKLPWWLANCTYLYLLDVEDNSLTDELPSGIIAGKRQLKYLHLSNNYRFSSHDGNTNLEPFFAAVSNCSQILGIEAGAVGMGGRLPSVGQ